MSKRFDDEFQRINASLDNLYTREVQASDSIDRVRGEIAKLLENMQPHEYHPNHLRILSNQVEAVEIRLNFKLKQLEVLQKYIGFFEHERDLLAGLRVMEPTQGD